MTTCLSIFIFIIKSITAGISIGLGGLIFSLTNTVFQQYINKSSYWLELGKIIASDLFSVGLWLVCRFKLMLYTGKIGTIFESNQSVGISYYVQLFIMMILNVAAAYGFGLGVYYLTDYFKSIEFVNAYMLYSLNVITNGKVSINHLKTLFQSFFCGTCVYLSVKAYIVFNGNWKAVIILNWFVFIFVYNGFQHCIANSFYFGQSTPTNQLNKNIFINVAICVIGNCLGTLPVSLLSNYLIDFHSSNSSSSSKSSSSSSLSTDEEQ